MPYKITFVVDAFPARSEVDRLVVQESVARCLRALTATNTAYLRLHPETPPLKTSGVRFDEQPYHETWHDIPSLLQAGVGSWPSLAAWRTAELRVRGGQKNVAPSYRMAHRSLEGLSRITFSLGSFPCVTAIDKKHAHTSIAYALRALTEIDCAILRAHPETPSLYASGVRYEEEPPGEEDWADIPTARKLGWGDCEDLACWRAAELQLRSGVKAWPMFLWRGRPRGGMLYHIQVRYPDGRVEDPSRRLGMK